MATTATITKANDWVEYMVEGANLGSDSFIIALSNTAPASETSNPLSDGNGVIANITQISYTNYTDNLTVDRVLEGVTSSQTGGTLTFDSSSQIVITASGGSIADFRYMYVCDDTLTGDPVVCVFDFGATKLLGDGDSLTFDFNASGILTVA